MTRVTIMIIAYHHQWKGSSRFFILELQVHLGRAQKPGAGAARSGVTVAED